MKSETITILDFGSQYTQLIARRIRELKVHATIVAPSTKLEDIESKGIILSGGPQSVDESLHKFDKEILQSDIPVLGICFGMQLMNQLQNGRIEKKDGEFGKQPITIKRFSALFADLSEHQNVWMSHSDRIASLADCYQATAYSHTSTIAAIHHKNKHHYGLQFHPEVYHTENGTMMIENFLTICDVAKRWSMQNYIEHAIHSIQKQVGEKKVVSLISGGVDSTVSTMLCTKALGQEKVDAIFIDNGLLREEDANVIEYLTDAGLQVRKIDASKKFLHHLQNIQDPEEKRKIIGDIFIEVANQFLSNNSFLCQGTLYTDLIESGKGVGSHAKVIKSHHNVNSPLVQQKREAGLIVEPNKDIFKDEVREVGRQLGIPDYIVERHPFPGPGLAVRILGEITEERCDILRKADAIFVEELRNAELYRKIWQAFAVLVPLSSVGVTGDYRSTGMTIALRAVTSTDGMTADVYPLPYDVLNTISTRIVNEITEIARVVYDTTTKPPATIEWL